MQSKGLGRYARFRIVLFTVLIGVIVFTVADGWAQTAAAPAAAKPAAEQGMLKLLFQLIMGHVDFVFITIAVLSMTGVTLIIQGFIKFRSSAFMPQATTNQIRDMIEQRKFKELIEFTENDPSFISRAMNPALKRAPSFSSMKEAMETAIAEQTAEQFRRIEYLNIIGNLGPLLGLLGTVLGMIEAFAAMKAAEGSASPAQLAGGISTALTHTFLGLLLAVPCLAAFGVLRTIVDRLTIRGALVAEELLLMIKPVEAKGAASAPRGVPQPAVSSSQVRKLPTATAPTPNVI